MIDSISIQGLRGFGSERKIKFAIPNDKAGSGTTFLVGENNSGKTTVLEALRVYSAPDSSPSFSERKRNKKCGRRVHIALSLVGGGEIRIDTVDRGGSQTAVCREEISENALPEVYVLQSRRFAQYEFSSNEMNRRDYLVNSQMNIHNRTSELQFFEARLFRMFEHKEEFDSLLKRVLGKSFEWTIEQNDNGNYYLKLTINGHEHSSEGMGDGYWSVFTICDALYDSKPRDVIAIDEPELSLHPDLQKRVMSVISEYARDRQIILSTHSPYFIDVGALASGAELYRVVKNGDGDTTLFRLTEESKKMINGFMSDYQKPFMFGIEAKELFFLRDCVIVVEGQEDVALYRRAAEQLGMNIDGDFFGWGAGGAGNIRGIMSMLHDLGYERVVAIFDGDRKEDFDKAKAEERFSGYKVLAISADDIRDKKDKGDATIKVGMMDGKGRLKGSKKDEMAELLNDINHYFANWALLD